MRKLTSTNLENEVRINEQCGMAYTLSIIGGRWKPSILAHLLNERKLRYSELKKRLTGISERMLIAQLRELKQDGIVNRIAHPVVPPRVEYELTPLGHTLKPVLMSMSDWGEKYRVK